MVEKEDYRGKKSDGHYHLLSQEHRPAVIRERRMIATDVVVEKED